jgi:hypothetical protein
MRSIPLMYDREHNEIQGDLMDEYLAIQAAEFPMEKEPEMASEEEIQQLLGDLWDEVLPLQPSSGVGNVTVLDRDDEYTERDAFNDFIADQHEGWN